MSELSARRLHRHLRDAMRRQAPATRLGPFTCFLHPESRDASLNVAIPDEPSIGRRVPVMGVEAAGSASVGDDDPALGLVLLKAHFSANRRTPRVELVLDATDDITPVMAEHGFREDARTPLLACTRATWKQVDPPADVHIEPILESTGWDQVKRYLEVQREAYEIETDVPENGPRGFWPAMGLGAGLLIFVGGEPAAAGGITPSDDGMADVRGLAVRNEFRGRGLGTFLLSALARIAHETGTEALLATPDRASDVAFAARAGFVPVATLVSYTAEVTTADAAAR